MSFYTHPFNPSPREAAAAHRPKRVIRDDTPEQVKFCAECGHTDLELEVPVLINRSMRYRGGFMLRDACGEGPGRHYCRSCEDHDVDVYYAERTADGWICDPGDAPYVEHPTLLRCIRAAMDVNHIA